MILTKEQRKLIEAELPELVKFLEENDIDSLLEAMDIALLDYMDKDYNLSTKGVEIQKLYDAVYYQNEEK